MIKYYLFTLKVIIMTGILLFVCFSDLLAEEIEAGYSLDDCIKTALDNSLGIKKIQEDLNAAQYGYDKTLKDLGGIKVGLNLIPKTYKYYDQPVIIEGQVDISEAETNKYKPSESEKAVVEMTKLFPTGSKVTLETKIDRDVLKGELEDVDASYESFQKPEIKLQFNQPFFLYKKNPYQRNLKKAIATLEIAKEDFNSSREELIYQVKKAYFSCLLAEEKVKIQEEAVKQTEILYHITNANLKAGKVPEINLMQVEIQLEETKESLLSTIDDYEMECEKLKSIIGLPQETKIRLTDELNYNQSQLQEANFDEVFSMVLKRASGIKKKDLMLQLSQMDLEKVKEMDKPDIFLNIDCGYQDKKIEGMMNNITSSSIEKSNSWEVSLNLNCPIFDSGKVKTEVKEYSARIKSLRYDLMTEKEKIRLHIQEIDKKITKIKRQIASLDKRREEAESVLRIANLRYKEGIGTIIEIMQAQKTNSELKFKKKEAVFNLLLILAELEKFKSTAS